MLIITLENNITCTKIKFKTKNNEKINRENE